MSNDLFNIGICMKRDGKLNVAVNYFQKALGIATNFIGDDYFDSTDILYELGVCYQLQNHENNAKRYFQEALDIMKDTSRQDNEKGANIMEIIADMVS